MSVLTFQRKLRALGDIHFCFLSQLAYNSEILSKFVLLSHSIRDYGLFRGLFFINLSVFFYQHAQRPCHVAIVACF